MKINKFFLSECLDDNVLLSYFILKIKPLVNDLSNQYPNIENWYQSKVIPGLIKGNRNICIYKAGDEIAGLSILKDDYFEKKICTLRVNNRFQRMGIGEDLIRESFKWLDTEKPVITVSNDCYPKFKKLFNKFGFEKQDIKKNYYKFNSYEIAFNGALHTSDEQYLMNRWMQECLPTFWYFNSVHRTL